MRYHTFSLFRSSVFSKLLSPSITSHQYNLRFLRLLSPHTRTHTHTHTHAHTRAHTRAISLI